MRFRPLSAVFVLLTTFSVQAELADDLSKLRAVSREGQGNDAAADAWKVVAQAKADELPVLLAAMDEANPLAENWLRAAISVVEDREAKSLPLPALKKFVLSTKHSAGARALAFDILSRHAKDEAEAITPMLIEDPGAELRRHPVARLIEAGDAALAKNDKAAAVAAYQQGLKGARDEDQIKALTKKLRDQGQTVDLPGHFGFLMSWKVIAPFSNEERKGFDAVYPPEKELNYSAKYPGKGKEAAWVDFTSKDEYGKIDFNKPFGMEKQVVGYAAAEFTSPEARSAEIRIGCKNGWKVWLNGELLFGRDEYHRGAKLDQYKLPCQLKAGKNVILVKCCQNEQTEQWTVEWEFQLRVCDATGTAIAASK